MKLRQLLTYILITISTPGLENLSKTLLWESPDICFNEGFWEDIMTGPQYSEMNP